MKGQLPSMQLVISKEVYCVVSGENTDCSSHREKVERRIVEGGNHGHGKG